MVTDQGTGALDAAIEASVLAYDAALNETLRNPPGYVLGEAGRVDLANGKAWRAAIEAAVRAAAPLIPVTEQQRADIERDALDRYATALERIADVKPREGRPSREEYRIGLRTAAAYLRDAPTLRARAASVGTEEGRGGR